MQVIYGSEELLYKGIRFDIANCLPKFNGHQNGNVACEYRYEQMVYSSILGTDSDKGTQIRILYRVFCRVEVTHFLSITRQKTKTSSLGAFLCFVGTWHCVSIAIYIIILYIYTGIFKLIHFEFVFFLS